MPITKPSYVAVFTNCSQTFNTIYTFSYCYVPTNESVNKRYIAFILTAHGSQRKQGAAMSNHMF